MAAPRALTVSQRGEKVWSTEEFVEILLGGGPQPPARRRGNQWSAQVELACIFCSRTAAQLGLVNIRTHHVSCIQRPLKVSDSYRTSVLPFSPGGSSEGGRYTPQSSEIVGILKQKKDEISADLLAFEEEELVRKNNHQGLMEAKTQEISGLTKTIEEKTMLQGTLSVKVEKMKSELFEAERTLFADKEMASKLADNCSTQASEWEERQRMRAAELLANQETIKLMNHNDSLELCKETLPSMTTDGSFGTRNGGVAREARSVLNR